MQRRSEASGTRREAASSPEFPPLPVYSSSSVSASESVYISEARVRCSLTTHARHSAHGELDKLHLEGSFAVGWNARCGWKTISHLLSASAPGWKHLNPSDSLSVSSRQHAAVLRSAVCLFSRCQCDDVSRLICCNSACVWHKVLGSDGCRCAQSIALKTFAGDATV